MTGRLEPPAPVQPEVGVQQRPALEAHQQVLAARQDGLDLPSDQSQPPRGPRHRRQRRLEALDRLPGQRSVQRPGRAEEGVAFWHYAGSGACLWRGTMLTAFSPTAAPRGVPRLRPVC